GARTRTWEWRNQNPLPYHLATPQWQQALRSERAEHRGAVSFDQRLSSVSSLSTATALGINCAIPGSAGPRYAPKGRSATALHSGKICAHGKCHDLSGAG